MCQDMVAEKERMKEKQIVGLDVQQRAADVFYMHWRTRNKMHVFVYEVLYQSTTLDR